MDILESVQLIEVKGVEVYPYCHRWSITLYYVHLVSYVTDHVLFFSIYNKYKTYIIYKYEYIIFTNINKFNYL